VIAFHRVLIGTAIACFAGFALWAVSAFRGGGPASLLVLGVLSAGAAVALAVYLKNLRRFLGR
jgi:hypothetical protein